MLALHDDGAPPAACKCNHHLSMYAQRELRQMSNLCQSSTGSSSIGSVRMQGDTPDWVKVALQLSGINP